MGQERDMGIGMIRIGIKRKRNLILEGKVEKIRGKEKEEKMEIKVLEKEMERKVVQIPRVVKVEKDLKDHMMTKRKLKMIMMVEKEVQKVKVKIKVLEKEMPRE